MSCDAKSIAETSSLEINIGDEHGLKYWEEKLGVSREKLHQAVSEVGPQLGAVRAFLNRSER